MNNVLSSIFLNRERFAEIARFGVVGTTAMMIHYGVYFAMSQAIGDETAFGIGYFKKTVVTRLGGDGTN